MIYNNPDEVAIQRYHKTINNLGGAISIGSGLTLLTADINPVAWAWLISAVIMLWCACQGRDVRQLKKRSPKLPILWSSFVQNCLLLHFGMALLAMIGLELL